MSIFETRGWLVRGRRHAPDVDAVLGIPYAAPPFGANRFREPRPGSAWSGVRNCGEFGPIAPQSARLPGSPTWSSGDEGILTVNVWTPASADGSLPVLFWIHGGAYTFGSSAQPDRAIAHSVASPCYSIEVAAATTLKVAAMAGSRATPESLSSTSPQVLVAASDRVVDEYRDDPASGGRHYDPVIYAPVVDGDVLPTDPLSGVAAGSAREVGLLVCHTTEESWLFDAVGSSAKVATDEQVAMFATDFGLPDDLMAGYRAGMPNAPVLDIYLAIFGDLMFGEFTCRLAERQAQSGGRAFMSRFARHRNDAGQVVRAWHCSDIPSAFGNLDNDGAAFLVGGTSNAAERDLSRRMVRAWADFATTGDPGWPPIMGSTTPVRTWNADDTAATATATATATDEPLDRRALWRNVDLPFLPL